LADLKVRITAFCLGGPEGPHYRFLPLPEAFARERQALFAEPGRGVGALQLGLRPRIGLQHPCAAKPLKLALL
jgi:hypothetical protein